MAIFRFWLANLYNWSKYPLDELIGLFYILFYFIFKRVFKFLPLKFLFITLPFLITLLSLLFSFYLFSIFKLSSHYGSELSEKRTIGLVVWWRLVFFYFIGIPGVLMHGARLGVSMESPPFNEFPPSVSNWPRDLNSWLFIFCYSNFFSSAARC